MIEQFKERLRLDIRDKMNNMADHVAGGGCVDWSEYKYNVGKIAGWAEAERSLLDLYEAYRNQGDENDGQDGRNEVQAHS
jgi:hypothetical protein